MLNKHNFHPASVCIVYICIQMHCIQSVCRCVSISMHIFVHVCVFAGGMALAQKLMAWNGACSYHLVPGVIRRRLEQYFKNPRSVRQLVSVSIIMNPIQWLQSSFDVDSPFISCPKKGKSYGCEPVSLQNSSFWEFNSYTKRPHQPKSPKNHS